MLKNLSRRTVQYVNVLSLSVASFFSFNFLPVPLAPAPAEHMLAPTAISTDKNRLSFADSSRLNSLYNSLQLDSLGLNPDAFHRAVNGFLNLVVSGQVMNTGVLSIIDFSKPSNEKRLYVVDMLNGTLLFNTWVAHGRNSGKVLPTKFSNRRNSYMSSLGFYVTGDPFVGHHGYSLKLEGIEKGWNDNAFGRSIIMHPAKYVSEEYIRQRGFCGRSEGCPAIPQELDRAIIDSIRGGSCLFIFSPDIRYLYRSKLAVS